ncbi:hypothetical protein ACFWIO_19010 [Streptomyces diastatochromogenes]|uniref:hypothetical protein n=1 Tax=Streptomyces diastatochromogenes TaxID=42236 RepID=UPI00364FD717
MKIFGREPAALLAFVAVGIKLLAAFGVGLSDDQQAVLNAVAAAAVGLIVAVMAHDALAAPLYGLAQAALALAVGFGLHWSADQQAVVLSFVQVAIAMFVRTQITAKVPAGSAAAQPRAV